MPPRAWTLLPGLEPRAGRSALWAYLSPLLALAFAVLFSAGVNALLGKPPLESMRVLWLEPLLTPRSLAELFVKAAPLVLIATGLALGFRANVWNVGAEGQFVIGAIAGGGVGLILHDAAWPLWPLMILAGALGGMAWAAIPAFLKTRCNASEILTSLMLTYVAQLFLLWLVAGPWQDPEGYGFPHSRLFSAAATLPILVPGTRIHLGVALAALTALAGWLVLARTLFGFQLRVLGLAPRAAAYAGFSRSGLTWRALLLSGGLAGIAGLCEAAGPIGQLAPSLPTGYGFTAIILAFLGRLNPLGILAGGFVLAISYLGGEKAQIVLGLPAAVAKIEQSALLFFLLAGDLFIRYRLRWRAPAAVAHG
jgi:general nucleoside transport system permease protein